MVNDLSALSSMAGILSEVFINPRADLRERADSLARILPQEGGPALLRGALAAMAGSQQPPEEREAEFVRLFQHSAGLPCAHPYESVYAHGRMMAPELIGALEAIFWDAGLTLQSDLRIPLDHIGLELEALSYFLAGAAEAHSCKEDERKWRGLASRLIQGHLIPFSEAFVGRLKEAKPDPYFAAAAEALSILIPLASSATARKE